MEKGTKCQWIKGDNFGTIEIFDTIIDDDGVSFYLFESRNRCSTNIFKEYMTLNIDSLASNVFNQNNFLQEEVQKTIENPITPLVRDQLKQNSSKIVLTLEIPVIKKELYDILKGTYKDMFEILVNTIVTDYVSNTALKTQLESKLKIYYTPKNTPIDSRVLEVEVQEF